MVADWRIMMIMTLLLSLLVLSRNLKHLTFGIHGSRLDTFTPPGSNKLETFFSRLNRTSQLNGVCACGQDGGGEILIGYRFLSLECSLWYFRPEGEGKRETLHKIVILSFDFNVRCVWVSMWSRKIRGLIMQSENWKPPSPKLNAETW